MQDPRDISCNIMPMGIKCLFTSKHESHPNRSVSSTTSIATVSHPLVFYRLVIDVNAKFIRICICQSSFSPWKICC
jgi:hypothetical protein